MYKGIGPDEVYPYVLRGERDSIHTTIDEKTGKELPVPASAKPTIWGLRPQGVRKGNRNLVGYMKSQGKHTDDAVGDSMTKQDLSQFESVVAYVKNFCFKAALDPVAEISTPEELHKVFFEIDFNSMTELFNASRDIFALREGEKNASRSLSGAASIASTQAGSASTATGA